MDESQLAEHPNLCGLFGGLWCFTLAPGSVAEVMARMGVDPGQKLVPMTFLELVEASDEREQDPDSGDEYQVALGARSVAGGEFTAVVQYDGARDWIGVQEDVLTSLANPGRAASHFFGGDLEVWCAENGSILFAADAATWRSWGPQPRLFADFLPAQFRGFDDLGDARVQASEELAECLQFTSCIVEAFVGCRLTSADLTGPWQVGWVSLSVAPPRA